MRLRYVVPMTLLISLVIPAFPANAHVQRIAGAYHLEIGWGEEPAVAGTKNTVEVSVTRSGKAILDVGDALKAEVTFGDANMTIALEPGGDDRPGVYRGLVIPTRAGKYTFHIVGSIKGQKVDLTATSGSDTFDDVTDATQAEFPVKDPTLGQIAERLDRAIPRLESRSATLERQLRSARSKASTAQIFGLIGVVLGALGLGIGAMRLRR